MAASEERRLQALVLAPVRRVQRRLNAFAWAQASLVPLWATVTACVLARLLLRGAVVWALPPLVLAGLAWCFLRARTRGVSLEHAAVLADRSANAGGLLLTRLERPMGEWELSVNQLVRDVKLPVVAWRRPVGALLGALLFLLVGFLLPLPAPKGPRAPHAAAAAKVDAVKAQAEALAREEPLGEAVEDELRRLAEEVAAGRFDSGDWEAADSLEQRLAERAAEAAVELAQASEAARDLEEALGAAGGAESSSREREALERALMGLEGEGEGEDSQGPGEASAHSGEGQQGPQGEDPNGTQGTSQSGQQGTSQSGQQGTADSEGSKAQSQARRQAQARAQASGAPDQISELRRSLERRQQSLSQRFEPREGQGAQASSQRSGSRRKQGARQRSEGASRPGQDGEQQGEGQGEGQGQTGNEGHASRGVRRGTGTQGGGPSPLVFGGEAEMDPDRLSFEPLPEGQGGEAGELWGLEAADPRRGTGSAGAAGSRGTSARGEATAGPGAQPLLPRNRDLVKRYFGGE
ncbi:hypothetical protein FJV41_01330 [Myxococcus llanfairpwllgwyngyllgogerychwyrndrobwllllantysiliogogogochensis]|uniref:Uncharacterized protein n=1 Tax=Myxococcus llanfairpwllgwyngyllgogerychwyrndrobwllllantysiliogogogochensis TaxID=2590453 RepID=A0A540X974_9BACT|nr:hypothetical protein [Myxococcus llanfairpwllgwyngyllgogerychwyrndrobwllllantysiliogogogochensis]TQF17817.1 hypothetical protein FJV41_01330 [Myxococcus llanfairpwllgwyngyllgogerychwyrndrobwllllantysiliogogogochensis]